MYAMPVVRATVHEHYSHYYDDEAIDKVVQCAAWDIDFSEYTYDECK